MRTISSISITLLILATAVGCGEPPPSPVLKVTSPERSLFQRQAGPLTVAGTATPGTGGDRIVKVMVNDVAATLKPDGSFTATIDAPTGAMLINTVATADSGASATDIRAVQCGQLRAFGRSIERATTSAVSTGVFERLSLVAGETLKTVDLVKLLAPYEPLVSAGDSLVNLQLSLTGFKVTDDKLSLVPVAGGLAFGSVFDGFDLAVNVVYAGALVPDGMTPVTVHADHIEVSGTVAVTPSGTGSFATKLTDPVVHMVGLRVTAPGLTGAVLDLFNSVLGSTIDSVATSAMELLFDPLLNQALGAVAGPLDIDVFGRKLTLQASPSEITLTPAGAQVALNFAVKLEGSEASPGYIFTDNGAPAMDVTHGVQFGLADDLVNEMLAQMHAVGAFDIRLQQDFRLFDGAQFRSTMPPMISANARDGATRLVIGDLIATFTQHGTPVLTAAVNAQVEIGAVTTADASALALQFGAFDVQVNGLNDASSLARVAGEELLGAASAGIGLQLQSLGKVMSGVPVPSVAATKLGEISLASDSGYIMLSAQVR